VLATGNMSDVSDGEQGSVGDLSHDHSGFADAPSQATIPHVTASRTHERKASDACENASAPWCAVNRSRARGWGGGEGGGGGVRESLLGTILDHGAAGFGSVMEPLL
jgi:hypothetical protein